MKCRMKSRSWPRLEWKLKRKGISCQLLQESCFKLCNVIGDRSSGSLSGQLNGTLQKLRDQVTEFLRRLKINTVMHQAIHEAIELYPLLDLIRECDATVEGSSSREACFGGGAL